MALPRLLLADDHAESRRLLRELLEAEFDVVGDVADGEELVSTALQLAPDVVVTDIAMPRLDGLAASARIRRARPEARIVFVTAYGDADLVERGLADGALGFVLKCTAGDDLVPAVREALAGRLFVSEMLSACHVRADR